MNMFYTYIGKGLLMREKLAPSAISYFFRAKSPMDVQEESSRSLCIFCQCIFCQRGQTRPTY